MDVQVFEAGGYRYIKAFFQYSGGIAAEPGYEIERARFAKPLRLNDAYAAVAAHLEALGRPSTAFAACELRSPKPFTEQGFIDFNRVYVKTLARWGLYKENGESFVNPVARTNVCPAYNKPAEPVMYAFSYTVPRTHNVGPERASFILSGGGERDDAAGKTPQECIVRYGDTSPDGMREKARYVLAEMERRLQCLGLAWRDAGTTQAYTVQNIGHLVGELFAARGAAEGGLVWSYARPPVEGLDFEMDVRSPAREIVI